jgi:hypothetical protein
VPHGMAPEQKTYTVLTYLDRIKHVVLINVYYIVYDIVYYITCNIINTVYDVVDMPYDIIYDI